MLLLNRVIKYTGTETTSPPGDEEKVRRKLRRDIGYWIPKTSVFVT